MAGSKLARAETAAQEKKAKGGDTAMVEMTVEQAVELVTKANKIYWYSSPESGCCGRPEPRPVVSDGQLAQIVALIQQQAAEIYRLQKGNAK